MAAANNNLHKYIVWGLLASTILFLILFILFTILFATKDDNSSSFLLTGTSNSGEDAVLKDVKDKLSKKFHVNDIHLEVVDSLVTGVFSLRGKQTLSKVQVQINLATTVKNSILTDGSKSYSACQSQCPAPIVCPTNPPVTLGTTTATPPTTTTQATTTAPTNPPILQSFYCNDLDLQREIVVVVDLISDQPTIDADRKAGLTSLGQKMALNFDFGPTRVFVLAADVAGQIEVSTNFTSNSVDFMADWKKLLTKKATDSSTDTLGMNSVFSYIQTLQFDPKKPIEVVVLTAHKFEVITDGNLLNTLGYFVAVAKATNFGFDDTYTKVSSTGILDYASFADLAKDDPFSTFACQFSYQMNAPKPQAFLEDMASPYQLDEEDAIFPLVDVNNTCEKVDIMFVFDTSVSVTSPLLENYKQFAIDFAARFTMSGDPFGDNIQVGIIQFSNTATVLLELSQNNLQYFANFVHANITNTGGMTNIQDALQKCIDQFNRHWNPAHGRFVVFMTDGHHTVGDTAQTQKTGQELATFGPIFFVGDGNYDTDDIQALTNINSHREWIYNTTDTAMAQMPAVVLTTYPCPTLIGKVCEVAYYAIEVSEAVNDVPSHTLNDSIQFVIKVLDQYNQLKPNATYQLMFYNAVQRMVPNTPTDYKTVRGILTTFNSAAYTAGGAGGHIDLDGAFYYLANIITSQTLNYTTPYHSSVVFCGEANTYTIDPLNNVQNVDKAKLLQNAYNYLEVQTDDIYVFDGSQANSRDYGADLWAAAVPVRNIVNDSATAYETFATNTNYFADIQNYSCTNVLEPISRCDYNFIDVAVVLDIVGDFPNITTYLSTLISQFATNYPSHFSMFAMGDGNSAVVLEELQAWPNVSSFTSDAFSKWEQWKIQTTTAATTTTTATTTAKKQLFEDAEELATNYPMNNGTLQGLFNSLHYQFGCNHYGYGKDRVDAPNIVMIVSDNFDSYTAAMWNSFPDLITETWGCSDCAGKPQFFFLSLTNTTINHGLGSFQVYGDLYNLNMVKSIRYMSYMVNSICAVRMPNCLTLDTGVMCAAQPGF